MIAQIRALCGGSFSVVKAACCFVLIFDALLLTRYPALRGPQPTKMKLFSVLHNTRPCLELQTWIAYLYENTPHWIRLSRVGLANHQSPN